MATKVYRNTGDTTLDVLGVGEIAPGEQVSVTSEYQPHVVLENYPGLQEVSDEEVNQAVSPDETEDAEGDDGEG